MGKFLSKYNYDQKNSELPWRFLTVFQALVKQLHPQLNGIAFHEKVNVYQEQWNSEEIRLVKDTNKEGIPDPKKFYKMFGVGLQIWSSKKTNGGKKRHLRKVFDSYWHKKMVFEIEEFDIYESIYLNVPLKYIIDRSSINYYACPLKYCLFGTNDQQRYRSGFGTT